MGKYPKTEATMAEIDAAIAAAKNCKHEHTIEAVVEESLTDRGTLLDEEHVEVCTNYYCGAVVRSGL